MYMLFGAVIALALSFGSTGVARAQTGFLLGAVAGAAFAGGSSHGPANPDVLYLAPRAAERIKDPLDVRHMGIDVVSHGSGYTLREYFSKWFRSQETADRFEILQVVRVASEGSGRNVFFWFLYVEKEKLVAHDKLPTLAESKKQD